jgi:DNA-binding response OmpR family regulator
MNLQGQRIVHPVILLANKGDGFRGLPRFFLRDQGYCVLEAYHGLEALFVARRSPSAIDVLIAEEDLPLLPARELADHLRSINPELKTILLTDKNTDHRMADDTLRLSRNCSEATLLRSIRMLLGRRDAAVAPLGRDLLILGSNVTLPRRDVGSQDSAKTFNTGQARR